MIFTFWNKFQFNVKYIFFSNLSVAGNAILQSTSDKGKPMVFDLSCFEVNSLVEDNISKAMYNLENKYKIMLRSDRELFMDRKLLIVEKKK